jgi:F420-non-reducing hydrogenase small subunit
MEKTMPKKDKKLKFAIYWAASCGGCDVAVVELGLHLLTVIEKAEILFWPAAMDFKYKDVEAMPDNHIDVCLYNGSVRTSENEHIAKLLRRKSKIMVAFGSCAYEGCIPGLANLYNRGDILTRVYQETPSTDAKDKTMPKTRTQVPEGELELPEFYDWVKPLAMVVPVEYFVPGCPPVVDQVWNVFQAIFDGKLPAPGAVIGAGTTNVCEECERVREGTKVKQFLRPHQVIADTKKCFLEQGIICMGPATRAGCGRPCIHADMPCRGCYGPPEGVADQGAKMVSALMAIVDPEVDMNELVKQIDDPTGTFYAFSLADSLLQKAKWAEVQE